MLKNNACDILNIKSKKITIELVKKNINIKH